MLDSFEIYPASMVAGIDVLMKNCLHSSFSPWHGLVLGLPDLSQISRLRYIDVSLGNRHQKPIYDKLLRPPSLERSSALSRHASAHRVKT